MTTSVKTKKRIYAEISKVEDQEDGTIKVWGYASSGAKDSDDETITPEAMKAALPNYMKFGAVREMHQASAAGTAIEASVDDATGKTWFGAHVVDPVAVLKVQTKVYKGFSIGGKVTERDSMDKKIIKGLNLVEVSLVDRPANPEALFTLYKAERTEAEDIDELAGLLDAGTVTPSQVLELIKKSQTPAEEGTGSQGSTPSGGGAAPEPDAPLKPSGEVAKTEQTELKKGMYCLADFASLLNSIAYLAQDTAWEAQYEGDNSPIPAAIAAWLKTGLGIFQDMAVEESAELLGTLSALVDSKSGAADKVAKAGAKFSSASKKTLGEVHEAMRDCCEKLDKLGYKEDDDVSASAAVDTTKAAVGDDTNGISATEQPGDDLNKAIAIAIAPLQQQLESLGKENTALKGQIETLGKSAAPGKALLRRFTTINKSQDTAPSDDPATTEVPLPPEGTQARAEHEMRKVFQNGGTRLVG